MESRGVSSVELLSAVFWAIRVSVWDESNGDRVGAGLCRVAVLRSADVSWIGGGESEDEDAMQSLAENYVHVGSAAVETGPACRDVAA